MTPDDDFDPLALLAASAATLAAALIVLPRSRVTRVSDEYLEMLEHLDADPDLLAALRQDAAHAN